MLNRHRLHELAAKTERSAADRKQSEIGHAAAFGRVRLEHVRKRTAQIRERRCVRVHGHGGAAQHVVPAHLIQAHDVVGMRVRIQHRVDAVHPGAHELKDAVGSGVGPGATIVGTVISFVVAYGTVVWLIRFVAHHPITWFVWYRVALGALIVVLLASGAVDAT